MTRGAGFLLAAGLALALPLAAPPARAGGPCERAIAAAEARHAIPPGLLQAMGEAEAGFGGRIWPWSLNVAGRPYRFERRDAAERFLADVLASGRRNVDAGCLQLNFQWAAEGMSPAAAIDPATNVDRAVRWLLELRRVHGSWGAAVVRYHSARPERMAAYECRVALRWAKRRGEALDARCPE